MYVERILDRHSPPAILLNEAWRQHGRVRRRTNHSDWPPPRIEPLRRFLSDEPLARTLVSSMPHWTGWWHGSHSYKMAKHFAVTINGGRLAWTRSPDAGPLSRRPRRRGAPAERRRSAKHRRGSRVHSFDTLLAALATRCAHTCLRSEPASEPLRQLTPPSPLQVQALAGWDCSQDVEPGVAAIL